MSDHATELRQGQRFDFGGNWASFLSVLDDERIAEAERSLREMLDLESLAGKKFLDIGSGSGLFSLAARRLGAEVFSFDYDPKSVACTKELKRRYFPDDERWTIEAGSVLEPDYLTKLGAFDVVYSWGVLHHTGQMWQAFRNISAMIAPGGYLFISIYNDQGLRSRFWKFAKKSYCSGPVGKAGVLVSLLPYLAARDLARGILVESKRGMLSGFSVYKTVRGMSFWHDWRDWLGGYPFEVAKPEEIFDFFRPQGFSLLRLRTCGGGWGCNEFVFKRDSKPR